MESKYRPKPVAAKSITVVKRTVTNIKFKWNIVETMSSSGLISTIYLATIKIRNGQIHQESVLGLVCVQIIMFLHGR